MLASSVPAEERGKAFGFHRSGCAGGTVVRGVAGFTAGRGVVTSSSVAAGRQLPLVIQFVDKARKVSEVLPKLRGLAGERLITVQQVKVVLPKRRR